MSDLKSGLGLTGVVSLIKTEFSLTKWQALLCAAAALLISCGGSAETNCSEDTVLTCDCPEGLPGVVECRAGRLTDCMCPDLNGGVCVHNVQCDDGLFCNGIEICDPSSDDASKFGCRSGALKPECDDNIKCTVDSCNNDLNRCTFLAPDEDGDGHGDASCLDAEGQATGDDCDDENADRYPGNFEVCDDDDVDEDCDPKTFGLRDADGDGAVDEACCNKDGKKKFCGDDCDDGNLAVRPLQPEFCDKLDNDCDGDVDEQASDVPWYTDNDGDGFGLDSGDVILSCIPIVDRSLLPTDCNDSEPSRHPAQLEICDLADNNCNGLADEGSLCGFPLGIAVIPGAGAVTPGAGGSSGSGGASGAGGSATGGSGTGGSATGGSSAVSLDCDSRDITDATVVTDPGSTFATWSGVVHLTSDVNLGSGERLQIDPNTLVIVDPGVSFLVNGGRLNINGDEETPVKFCGKEATPGYWDGLHISSADAQSAIDWLLVSDGGGGADSSALRLSAPVVIHDVKVQNSGSNGVYATTFGLNSSGLSVTESAGYAVVVTTEAALTRLPLGGEYSGNVDDYVLISDSAWATSVTINHPGIPYLIETDIKQSKTTTVTINAGVNIVIGGEREIFFGWNQGSGTVIANGTAEAPIIFRSLTPGSGTWNGLVFGTSLTAESLLSHVEIRGAGVVGAAVRVEAKLRMNNVTINQSGPYALDLGSKGLAASSSGIVVDNTDGTPIISAANALGSIPGDTVIKNSGIDRIQVASPFAITDTGTIPNLGIPYFLPDTVNVNQNAILTLAAGSHFLFDDLAALVISYNLGVATLFVEGTAEAPVIFDHILSAGAGIPTAGAYSGLVLAQKTPAISKIEYLEIRHAGSNGKGAIWNNMTNSMPPENFTHVTISDSTSYCLYLDNDTSQDYSGNDNSFSGCGLGPIFPPN